MNNQLLTSEQTANLLGTQVSTLSVWRSTGRYHLPFIKIGRLVRYRLDDINQFLERRTRYGHVDALTENSEYE